MCVLEKDGEEAEGSAGPWILGSQVIACLESAHAYVGFLLVLGSRRKKNHAGRLALLVNRTGV